MLEIIKTITKREWQFVFFIMILVILVTTVPFIYNKVFQKPDSYYMGSIWMGGGDMYVYYTYIDQARNGQWLFENKFTSEPQTPALFNPLWLIMGWVAKIFNFSNFVIWHITRVALLFVLIPLLYIFLSYFFEDKLQRKLGLLLAAFSSGIFTTYSEASIFTIIFHSPQFILSLILILLIFLFVLLGVDKKNLKWLIFAGLCSLLLIIIHPYDIVTIYIVVLVFFTFLIFLRRLAIFRAIAGLGIIVVISGVGLLYYYYIFTKEAALGGWALQNLTPSPAFPTYIIAFGFLWLTTLVGLYYYFFKDRLGNNKYIFAAAWFVASTLLLYAPLQFNRKLMFGLQVPMVIFTTIALYKIYLNWVSKFAARVVRIAIIVAMGALLTANSAFSFFANFSLSFRGGYYYLPKVFVDGLHFLRNYGNPSEVMLASPKWNTTLSGEVGKRSFVASAHNTLNFYEKEAQTKWFFFDNNNDQSKINFLKENRINYIIYTALEKSMGDYNPVKKSYLNSIYQNEDLTIYAVK